MTLEEKIDQLNQYNGLGQYPVLHQKKGKPKKNMEDAKRSAR
jgi:hypothetical protein